MANAYTDSSTSALGNYLVQAAYDRYVEFALRAQPLFRQVADKRPVQQAMPGSSITFEFYNDLAAATGTLTETVDPDAVAVGNTTQVSVTLNEYGNATLATRKLEAVAFTDVDAGIANLVAWNLVDSIDQVVSAVLNAGTNVVREQGGTLTVGGATSSVTSTDKFASKHVAYAVSKLRGNKVVPNKGTMYTAYIHPDAAVDLRRETGSGGWLAPHEYQSNSNIWAGEVGAYMGASFIESPRCKQASDGASSAKVSRTLFTGRQALAEAVAIEPHVVLGPIVDKLNRFRPVGWYGLAGWSIYRQAALLRVETSSTW